MKLLSTFWRHCRDLLYPPICECCHRKASPDWLVCEDCQCTLVPIVSPYCQRCGEPFDGLASTEQTCPNCLGLQLSFDFAHAGFLSHGFPRDLIHRYKYESQLHLARPMAQFARFGFESDPRFASFLPNAVLIPVPLHPKRQRQRTYNQAEQTARLLSPQIHLPVCLALRRVRYTETQTHFTRQGRLRNLKNAFVFEEKSRDFLAGKNLILIDDVFTTGSTAQACAIVLKRELNPPQIAVLTSLRA